MKRIVIILLLVPPIILSAQNKLDSLLVRIKDLPDTVKVKELNQFTWKYRNKDFQMALQSAKVGLQIAQSIGSKKLQAEALNLTGVIYRDLGRYDKSLSLYLRALQLAQESKDLRETAYSYNNIGGIYRLEGNYPLAIEYILKALKLFEQQNDKEGAAFCTINIGLVYRRQHNYEKALEYFERTYNLREDLNDKEGKAKALSHIAEVYFEKGNYNEALNYYKQLEKKYTELGDKKGLLSMWSGIATVYSAQKEYDSSLEYRKKALQLAEATENIEGLITNHSGAGLLYARRGQFNIGEDHLKKGLFYARKIKSPYLKLECYKTFYQFYEIKSDFKNAFTYSQKYATLKDSIITQENISSVAEMEAVYKTDKVEKETALLLKDIENEKRKRDYWIVITLLVIIMASITYSRLQLKKIANKKLQELNAMKDKFFGIIAHDLKNPFNIIFGFTEILLHEFDTLSREDKLRFIREIDKSSRQTFKLLENLLYWSRSQTGRMDFKPKVLNLTWMIKETFSVFESLAKNKNISLSTNATDDVEAFGDEEMIKTVLRNLISNGIKFTNSGGKVSVLLKSIDGNKEITVEDTGVGIKEETKEKLFSIENVSTSDGTHGEKGTGLGLILCKEFVEKNGGTIRVESEIGKGSKFIFTIPSNN